MKTLAQSIRAPFLILAPVAVSLGLASASYSGKHISILECILVLIGALMAHISVNTFNEYADFKSGLDSRTNKTPFSGGSGALPANPRGLSEVFFGAVASFAITTLIGLYFLAKLAGTEAFLPMLMIGALGLIIILSYTKHLNRMPWLCLISPGLAFGPLMVVGSYLAMTGEVSYHVVLVSLVPFFLTNNLLLLNQIPDIEADKTVGRNHFSIAYGLSASMKAYCAMWLMAIITVIGLVVFRSVPDWGMLSALVMAIAGVFIIKQLKNSVEDARNTQQVDKTKLISALGLNVAMTLISPSLLALILFLN